MASRRCFNLPQRRTRDSSGTSVVEDDATITNVAEVDDIEGRIWVIEAASLNLGQISSYLTL